jgi:hypothetical protein
MMSVAWRDTVCALATVAALSCTLLITNNARAADYMLVRFTYPNLGPERLRKARRLPPPI